MRKETRVHYNGYKDRQCQLNSVDNASEKFAVVPSVQQRLENTIQDSSAFLQRINIAPVDELIGDKLGLGVNGPIASRTDTTGSGERQTSDVHTLTDQRYECKQTNYDVHVRYNTLDSWAKFPDFQKRLTSQIVQRCALDRIMIGFNGTSAAATTNRQANPLLQDVNVGWLQNIRTKAVERVMDEGSAGGDILVGGADADYKNLDSLVYDAYQELLDPWYTNDTGLVAIVGRSLMHDKLFPLVDGQTAPTEKLAADIIISQARLGQLQAIAVPYFPANAVLITRLDNLSIYYQDGARRRAVMDNPKRDRIETYESSNDAFVVEDFGACALIENIKLQ